MCQCPVAAVARRGAFPIYLLLLELLLLLLLEETRVHRGLAPQGDALGARGGHLGGGKKIDRAG